MVLKRLFVALFAIWALAFCADTNTNTSQQPSGTNESACQFWPSLGVGIGANTCRSNTNFFYSGLSLSTDCSSGVMNGNAYQSLIDDPNINPYVYMAYLNTSATNQPAVCAFNLSTGAAVTNTALDGGGAVCTANVGHNAPSVEALGGGYFGVTSCAGDTDTANCMTASGGAGGGSPTLQCQWIAIGNCFSTICAGGTTVDVSTAGHLYQMPMPKTSEISSASYGGINMMCGQVQHGSGTGLGYFSGAMGCITVRNIANHFYADTACTQGGSVSTGTSGYQIDGGTISTACNGGWLYTTPSSDDGLYWVDLCGSNASPCTSPTPCAVSCTDTNAGTITLTFPKVGVMTATATCTFTATGTASTDATNMAAAIGAGSGTGYACSGDTAAHVANEYEAHATVIGSGSAHVINTHCNQLTCVVVQLRRGNTKLTSGASNTTCSWTCEFTSTYTSLQGGTSSHFIWMGGGVRIDPSTGVPWYMLITDQQSTTAYSTPGFEGASSNGLNIIALMSRGPGVHFDGTALACGGCWEFVDASKGADGYTDVVSPATTSTLNFQLGGGGGGSCASNGLSDCQEYTDSSYDQTLHNVPPMVRPCTCAAPSGYPAFRYNYSLDDLAGIKIPFYGANFDFTFNKNGDTVIVFACQDSVQAKTELCSLTLSHTDASTSDEEFVDDSNTSCSGSGCGFQPNASVTYNYNTKDLVAILINQEGSNAFGCAANSAPCFIEYVSTDQGHTWGSRTVLTPGFTQGSASAAGLCGQVYDTPDQLHSYAQCNTTGNKNSFLWDLYVGNL